MDFGLSESQRNILIQIFDMFLKNGQVIVYGSRAKGTYTSRSDIDLIIKDSDISDPLIPEKIKEEIEESDFPYLADIQIYENINNIKLLEHVDRIGKILYEK